MIYMPINFDLLFHKECVTKKDTVQNGQEHCMKELHQMVNNVPTRGKPQRP